MKRYGYAKVAAACPDGTLRHLGADQIKQVIDKALADAGGDSPVEVRALGLISAARICRSNGYPLQALRLYKEALYVIANHIDATGDQTLCPLHAQTVYEMEGKNRK